MHEELINELRQQNKRLKHCLVLSGLLASSLLILAAKSTLSRQSFSEIDVERINIITPDGKKELVISNRQRFPAPIVDGQEATRDGPSRPGMIFYNADGNENGGFIFDGKLDKNGKPSAGMQLSMDRYGGDQQLTLGHYENNDVMESGLKLYDRGLSKNYRSIWLEYEKAPEGPKKEALRKRWEEAGGQQTTRMFVGKTRGKASAIILADAKGRPKIMMMVSAEGNPVLNFLDDQGKIVQSFPQNPGTNDVKAVESTSKTP